MAGLRRRRNARFCPAQPGSSQQKLDAAATKLNSGKAGKEEIAAILQEVAGIEDDRQQTRQQYAEELASVQKKLNALGPAPEKDESEPAAIAKQRKELPASRRLQGTDRADGPACRADRRNQRPDFKNPQPAPA